MKIDEKVYYMDPYGNVQAGIILEICTSEGERYYKVEGVEDSYGTSYAAACKCFPSLKELLDYERALSEERILQICSEIRTVEDLVAYMYSHPVCLCEEYTDWDARKAVALKAKELLGVNLERG